MSHIPASAMPHARASDDDAAAQPAGQEASPPEPTAATPDQPALKVDHAAGAAPLKNGDGAGDQARVMGVGGTGQGGTGGSDEPPLSSAAPGTGTGNRQGSDADRTAQGAGEPAATASTPGQPSVQHDGGERTGSHRRRTAGRAALALGGLAAIGGIIATVFPMVRDRNEGGKGKKGKKRKA